VTDGAAVRAVMEQEVPAAVVNCAAFTNVDGCEHERDACFGVNGLGAGNVSSAAAEAGARVIHVSTDYVFDGRSTIPYKEDDRPAPLSAYGESKLDGERRVAEAGSDYVIVRTAWLFGAGGANFVSKILARAKAGEPLRVVNDQRGSPTYAGHLAAALAILLRVEYRGVVHVAGTGEASWFDVAAEALRLSGYSVPLTAVTTADAALPARRPSYSVLDSSFYAALTGEVMPPWQEGLAAYLREVEGGEAGAG
jgi:dTDP-4-dehydrorhamnose reductase